MEPGLLIDLMVVISNLLLVLVTVIAVIVTFREGHRHEEKIVAETEDSADRDNKRLAEIVHEVLKQERDDRSAPEEPAS